MSQPHAHPFPSDPSAPALAEPRHADAAAAITLLHTWETEDKTGDPVELQARCAEWEATKAALNVDFAPRLCG